MYRNTQIEHMFQMRVFTEYKTDLPLVQDPISDTRLALY